MFYHCRGQCWYAVTRLVSCYVPDLGSEGIIKWRPMSVCPSVCRVPRPNSKTERLKPRSHRARHVASLRRASTRSHLAYLQVIHAYSIFIKLSITSLSLTSLSITSLSTDVVWWWSLIATRTFWPFIVIGSPKNKREIVVIGYIEHWVCLIRLENTMCLLYKNCAHWMYTNYLTRVDARRRGRCECLLSLTLVWFHASTRVDALGVNEALGSQKFTGWKPITQLTRELFRGQKVKG